MRCLFILIAVGFLWGLSPSRAAAACGDWLAGGASHGAALAENGEDHSRYHADSIQPAQPCDGPGCQRNSDPSPGGPPAPPVPPNVDHVAWMTRSALADISPYGRRRADFSLTRSRVVPGRLDRPPEVL